MDVFLLEKEPPAKATPLTAPADPGFDPGLGWGEWSAPESIEDFRSHETNWPNVIGIVQQGTRLRVTKIIEHGAWGWGSSIFVLAEILDGKHAGQIVDISDLSQPATEWKPNSSMPRPKKPDSRILQLVD